MTLVIGVIVSVVFLALAGFAVYRIWQGIKAVGRFLFGRNESSTTTNQMASIHHERLTQHIHIHLDGLTTSASTQPRVTSETLAKRTALAKRTGRIDLMPMRGVDGKPYIPLTKEDIAQMMKNPDFVNRNRELMELEEE